jgi:GSH-dependent disulfide-bond oxidoreductase
MPDLDLHTAATPNGQKASIMIEESGLPYTLHTVSLGKGEQKSPEFLALNPNGRIPVLVDGGRSIAESGAILLHLAERSGRLRPEPRDETLTWMFFQAAHVGPTLGQLGHFTIFAKEKVPAAIDRFATEATRLLDVLESVLSRRRFLGSDSYGLADIMTFPWLRMAERRLALPIGERPGLVRWMETVGARPAVQKGLALVPEPG